MITTNIIDDSGFERMLSRLAHEIVERNHERGRLAFVGLRTRGEYIAHRLRERVAGLLGTDCPFGVLDITLYRDDVRELLHQPELRATTITFDITGCDVILVDDVLFTGRTVRSALDALLALGRPRSIQLVVIVDRGHRELPIRADFIGKPITTSRGQEVRVRLAEVDGSDGIDLVTLD